MATRSNGSGEYRIDLSQQLLYEIKDLKNRAEQQGIEASFRSALQQIVKRLKRDPQDFGEIIRTLPHLQLLVHVGSVYPLTIRFAYHESNRIVYIMKLFLAPL